MFGRARGSCQRQRDQLLSRSRQFFGKSTLFYFFAAAIHESERWSQKQLSWMLTQRPSSFGRHDNDDDGDGRRHRHHGDRDFRIEVLSGRPDMVAGGDALVQVTVRKKHARLGDVRVELNGVDITDGFLKDTSAQTLTGPVTGMRLGTAARRPSSSSSITRSRGRSSPARTSSPTPAPRTSSPCRRARGTRSGPERGGRAAPANRRRT